MTALLVPMLATPVLVGLLVVVMIIASLLRIWGLRQRRRGLRERDK